MVKMEDFQPHILKWVEINLSQNLSIALKVGNGISEYSTVGGDTSPYTHQISSDPHVSPDSPAVIKAFSMMLIIGMIVTISVCIIGSIGNLLTMAVLICQFKLPASKRYITKITADTILILNLCIADFCYSIISLPFMFVIYKNLYFHVEEACSIGYKPIRDITCKWAAFIRYTNAITEWTTLGIMALERCVTIYRFQRKLRPTRLFSPLKTVYYLFFLWIFAISAQTLTLTEKYGSFGYNQDTLKCDFMPTGNITYFVTPRVFFFALESAVPCFFILIGYVVILTQVYSSKSFFNRSNSITSATLMSMCLRRSKTTRLIVLLLTMYLVCVIPICIYNVVIHEDELGDTQYQIIGIALYCLYWLQYACNNFIYVVSNEKFRNAYRQFFSLLLCRDMPSPSKSKYLRIQSDRICRIEAIMSSRNHPKMRLRTPSEMTIEGFNRRESLIQSQTQISILAINLNIQSLKEFPILVFPKAQLSDTYSISSINAPKLEKNRKFSTLSHGYCFRDFRKYKGRLSLTASELKSSMRRKRSLSV